MISNLFRSLRLIIAPCLFFSVFYIFALWSFTQVAGPNKDNAELVTLSGKVMRTINVSQNFMQDIYFWGHPSHAGDGYNTFSSAGSNRGSSNGEHLALLEERIDTFLVHHPYLIREKVPAEIITASSSGLDPHTSSKAAYAQAERVANARGWSEGKIMSIISSHAEGPLLDMFGTEKVNVLKLNAALDRASNNR